jgi:hypothetical protein
MDIRLLNMFVNSYITYMKHARCRHCFWCRKPLYPGQATKDHIIPVWVEMVGIRVRDLTHNIVQCCGRCNATKSGMPPALWFEVRTNPYALKDAQRKWQQVRNAIANGYGTEFGFDVIRREMLRDFPGKPIMKLRPEKPVHKAGPRHNASAMQTMKQFNRALNEQDRLKQWERLNELLSDRP